MEKIGRYVDKKNDGHTAENAIKYICEWFGVDRNDPNPPDDPEIREAISSFVKGLTCVGGIAYVCLQTAVPGTALIPVGYWVASHLYQTSNLHETVCPDEEDSASSLAVETQEQSHTAFGVHNSPNDPPTRPRKWWEIVKDFGGLIYRGARSAIESIGRGVAWAKTKFIDPMVEVLQTGWWAVKEFVRFIFA